ncbi:uncharacterized protein LOC130897531 [Diorhabda carinulata]|uniref:uncharacterized protein LOC130897531 n=1 Tax=Diorhabda carinulata TaxID=1163345 RepID=UPI0025A12319|nr:uncharacterized protein LOC130897531 [Diorhabda carinulata]
MASNTDSNAQSSGNTTHLSRLEAMKKELEVLENEEAINVLIIKAKLAKCDHARVLMRLLVNCVDNLIRDISASVFLWEGMKGVLIEQNIGNGETWTSLERLYGPSRLVPLKYIKLKFLALIHDEHFHLIEELYFSRKQSFELAFRDMKSSVSSDIDEAAFETEVKNFTEKLGAFKFARFNLEMYSKDICDKAELALSEYSEMLGHKYQEWDKEREALFSICITLMSGVN